jgi:legumain
MYCKLTFYLEACESGSMFDGLLPNDIDVYTTTAANPDESSWGTYCPPSDMVNGVEIGSCLGDEYSVHWMEDADRPDAMDESLEDQYLTVQKETVESHVMQYGEHDWVDLPVGDFEGNLTTTNHRRRQNGRLRKHKLHSTIATTATSQVAKVDSRDAKLQFLYWKYVRAKTRVQSLLYGQELQQEIQHRAEVDQLWSDFATALIPSAPETLLPGSRMGHPKYCGSCCKELFETVRTKCPALASDRGPTNGWDDYSLKYARTVVNACDRHTSAGVRTRSVQDMDHVLRDLCAANEL